MLQHPQIDPVALHLGPLSVHWYGLTYQAALGRVVLVGRGRGWPHPRTGPSSSFWRAPRRRAAAAGTRPNGPSRRCASPSTMRDVEDLLFWGVLGVILGGRLGYVLFYKPAWYASHPLEIFAIWQGGMSFHGGMLGVILAMMLWAWKKQRPWLQVTDLVAPCVPLGLAAGRIGNFINGELWGRVASPDLPWGMVFRGAGDLPRHPSQIYQALLEGVLLFVLLWLYARQPRKTGQVSGAFLVGYGVMRFAVEFFREPDAHLGLLGLGLSMGQWLCVPMIAIGLGMWAWASRR